MINAIDLFAGLGGQSTGLALSGIGKVLWAANHWPTAVEYHTLNHPDTIHACQDLHQANFSYVPDHDLMMASPCCQGHTNARGAEGSTHDASRSTAWAVVAAAEVKRPKLLLVENVTEFLQWTLYPAWENALNRLGYTLSPHILDAADYGVAQNRVRMFLVGSLSKNPIKLDMPKEDPISARTVIDLDAGRWSDISKPGRSVKTLARIKRGREELGTDTFLIPYYGSGSGLTGRSIDRPVGTITTIDRWAVIQGDKMRMLTVDENRKFMSFPDGTHLPDTKRLATNLLGNAVCPELHKRIVTSLYEAA
jgi:site-specific DNA-cytosine methylase